jgi:hypothetical protein
MNIKASTEQLQSVQRDLELQCLLLQVFRCCIYVCLYMNIYMFMSKYMYVCQSVWMYK